MHLAVNDTREHVFSSAIDAAVIGLGFNGANARNVGIVNEDIGLKNSTFIDEGCTLNEYILIHFAGISILRVFWFSASQDVKVRANEMRHHPPDRAKTKNQRAIKTGVGFCRTIACSAT